MTQIMDKLEMKEILEREFLKIELQTLLRDFGVQQYGRKDELIQRALHLIDENQNDTQSIEAAKNKITEIYNQRKNVDESVPKTAKKSSPLRTRNLIDSSFDNESDDSSSNESEAGDTHEQNKHLNMQKHLKRAAIHTSLALVVLAVVAYGLVNNKVNLEQFQKIRAQNLTEMSPRMHYVLQQSTPGVVWLLFCTLLVISKRINSPASIPTSGHEYLTESAKNIFLNSLEQFVMSLTSQLILVTYLTNKQTLNIIPVLNVLFITGRIFFWLGYPTSRGFGMTLNIIPLFATILFINYQYFGLFL